jgi:hypothetical protein
MLRIKNMSRGGWIVVGIVVAVLLVPSGVAVAKALAYSGIEGTSHNKADVTPAQQLLTTEALPSKYQDYQGFIDAVEGGTDCERVGSAIPSGDAFVAQQIEADVTGADSPVPYTGGDVPQSDFGVFADSASDACAGGSAIVAGDAPGGQVGDVAIPLVPGFVVPSGYRIDVTGVGIGGYFNVTGYLVPSADAPSTPQVVTNGKMTFPLPHAS